MKVIDLISAKNAFDLNSKFDGDMQLALKVVKFVKAAETEEIFYEKRYNEIVNRYAEKDNDGKFVHKDNGIIIKKDCVEDFSKEIENLNAVETEKPAFEFTADELNKCSLTGNGLYALYPFIKE